MRSYHVHMFISILGLEGHHCRRAKQKALRRERSTAHTMLPETARFRKRGEHAGLRRRLIRKIRPYFPSLASLRMPDVTSFRPCGDRPI